MPRTLPWRTEASSKKATPRKAQSERKRPNSPDDVVNSDLEPIGSSSSSPQRKPKKRTPHRGPSSSPPPSVKVAPTVEYMREGFTMDDRYMMVEDEFTTTAILFSLPLHQDEYERTRRRAKARGAETLKMIGHGTDGNVGQSRALRLKMEAEERAKKRKAVDADDSDEEEEEYMADPQLAGLMTASQSTPRKSLRGFASNSQRTPRIAAGRTRDAIREERVYRNISAIEEDDETEDEDEDDLDVFVPKVKPSASASTNYLAKAIEEETPPEPVRKPVIFKQFTNSTQAEREEKEAKRSRSGSPNRSSTQHDHVKPAVVHQPSPRPTVALDKTDAEPQPKPVKTSRTAAILAKRREAEKRAQEECISPEKQIKQELQSQVPMKEEPFSQTQGKTQIKREPAPSPVRQALASKSMAQRRAERAKKEAEGKQKSKIDDIPTFLY